MAEALQITLLGSPSVNLNGRPVAGFISAKAVALVYYLAATGRAHTRETLAGLLWGDFPEVNAKKNLRDVLSNLRKLMDLYLSVTRQTVELNRQLPYSVDSRTFESILQSIKLDAPEWEETTITAVRQAVDLYQGDFLDGFYVPQAPDFEQWLLLERERLRQLALQALHHLSLQYTRQGDYAAGIIYTNRLLVLEPWREEGHRQLMRLLAWSGQRTAALAQYENCRRILADELGVEPELETNELYEQIQAGALAPVADHEIRLQPTRPLHNLPSQLTPFVGRQEELAQLMALLTDPACRLLTLSGPGGVGKTRLALQAAELLLPQVVAGEQFSQGVYFVSLAPRTIAGASPDIDEVINPLMAAAADALNLTFSGQASLKTQLSDYLREKSLLLILDNFEYLISAAGFLADLLRVAPGLKLMVTSRSRLNIRGERILALGGLAFPSGHISDTDEWQAYSAVQLFCQTAQSVDPGFELSSGDGEAISRICQLVDGLPLGIELAASWVRMLTCQEIAREIEQNLSFLEAPLRDAPERHRSLWAVFTYSWNLLSAQEQQVLRQLSVFCHSFGREAAAQVAGATLPLLFPLVDNSLVRRIGPDRYELLETVRQYAAEKLAQVQAEEIATHQRHEAFYLSFLHQLLPDLQGRQQYEALLEVGREIENVRSAWRWAVAHRDLAGLGTALESLFHFYDVRSWFQEGADAFQRAAAAVATAPPDPMQQLVWGKLLARQGWFTFHLGRQLEARSLLAKSVELLRPLNEVAALVFPLNYLGAVNYYLGNYGKAQQLCQEALTLSQSVGDRYGSAVSYNILGQISYRLGEYEVARHYCQQSLAIEKEIDNRWSMAFSLANLGKVAYALADYAAANQLFEESMQIRESMGDSRGVALCLMELAETAVALGTLEEATLLYQKSLSTFREIGNQWGMMTSLAGLGHVACRQGAYGQAKLYYDDALQRAVAIDAVPSVMDILEGIMALWQQLGRREQVEQLRHLVQNQTTPDRQTLDRWVTQVLTVTV